MYTVGLGPLTLVVVLTAVNTVSMRAETDCSDGLGWSETCTTATNTGSTVEIGGTREGGSDSGRGGGRSDSRDADAADRTPATDPACDTTVDPLCYRTSITYTVDVIRPTLADVASFAPASLPLADEPDGVGIVGMPVNFVVTPAVHERSGELFDMPISVRFTPASVLFVHGDGTSRTSTSGGSTWAALDLPQFSATGTSHAYAARGTYSAHAVVRYRAEYNLGSGWRPIDGVLEIPTAATSLQILEVRTALVDLTCLENPTGPGC